MNLSRTTITDILVRNVRFFENTPHNQGHTLVTLVWQKTGRSLLIPNGYFPNGFPPKHTISSWHSSLQSYAAASDTEVCAPITSGYDTIILHLFGILTNTSLKEHA